MVGWREDAVLSALCCKPFIIVVHSLSVLEFEYFSRKVVLQILENAVGFQVRECDFLRLKLRRHDRCSGPDSFSVELINASRVAVQEEIVRARELGDRSKAQAVE